MQTGKLQYFYIRETIIVIYAYRFLKQSVTIIFSPPYRWSWDSERWRLAAGSESNVLLLKSSTAPKHGGHSTEVLCLQSCASRGGKKEFQVLHFMYYSVLLISAGFTCLSCGGLLFPEILNAPQVFLTKVVVWYLEAAFPVCTSVCLQLQLSLSKQVLYQMVTCNYFTLSLLNCPVLRPGNKTSILFVLFLSGSIRRPNVEYSASGIWIYSGKSCGLFFYFFCHFMAWISSDFPRGQLVSSQERRVRDERSYRLEDCPCSNSVSCREWNKMTKSGSSLLILLWIKGECGMVLDLLLMDSALIIKNSVVGTKGCIMLKTRGELSRYREFTYF